ncbi:hypothetical protein [Zeaxanthinibacter enoshimensis]|uniref:Uncharacterized protein n=1 Tax=Zeaxanthinibacter enoshimensis TaxID=392009 RepID=A0A4R6TSH5_9FLAO|nr:hypothetical protein [Zeaxanthinibacter enoshimensis]TDQ33277.1 hypothetical protein CLV82_1115 [Zeaxanthinibacter enoshimensis]
MSVNLSPYHILKYLLGFTLILSVGNLFSILSKLNSENRVLLSLGELFDFNTEANIPTLFSTILILLCSAALYYIYNGMEKDSRNRRCWLILSGVFLFLAIDETASIHERLIPLMRENFELSGYLYYAWIIPYSVLLFILGIIMIPFMYRLPRKIQFLILLSGILFLSGSLGMEMLGGKQSELMGDKNYTYALYYTIEEFLEMTGMTTFLYALLTYIVQHTTANKLKVNFK